MMTTLKKAAAFGGVVATAFGFATFAPTSPALSATFANTDAATITMSGEIELGDEQKFLNH